MTLSESRPTSAIFLTGIYAALFLFGCVVFLTINHFFPSFDHSVSGIIVMVVAAMMLMLILGLLVLALDLVIARLSISLGPKFKFI
ncbi:hypothetical protein [Shinella zoogloeoides]|uniref:hypothetical protein n=1 Tax=Shinella zoogloeoides TaxID=352475 RepID=UPI001F59D461|nr:hypothetical protein [Shinella zoogloeoides]